MVSWRKTSGTGCWQGLEKSLQNPGPFRNPLGSALSYQICWLESPGPQRLDLGPRVLARIREVGCEAEGNCTAVGVRGYMPEALGTQG